MQLDFSRLSRWELLGAVSALLGAITLFLLPWYSLDVNPQREAGSPEFNPDAFICGEGEFSCTGWETFPILRWLLIAAGTAPIILAWIVIRGHKLTWPPGELTMVVGFAGMVLIGYNGIVDKPGTGVSEIGVSLDYGYWVALLVGVLMSAAGYLRSLEGQRRARKAPGTV
jgi:hypothetical protein